MLFFSPPSRWAHKNKNTRCSFFHKKRNHNKTKRKKRYWPSKKSICAFNDAFILSTLDHYLTFCLMCERMLSIKKKTIFMHAWKFFRCCIRDVVESNFDIIWGNLFYKKSYWHRLKKCQLMKNSLQKKRISSEYQRFQSQEKKKERWKFSFLVACIM